MPDQNQGYLDDTSGLMDNAHFRFGTPDVKGKRKLDAVASGSSQPQKKKRRGGERERDKDMEHMSLRQSSRVRCFVSVTLELYANVLFPTQKV